jgi:hypothetical protein
MRIPVRIKFSDLIEIVQPQPDLDNPPYHTDALLQLKTPLGETTIPITKNAVLSISEGYRHGIIINRLRDTLRVIRRF